MGLDELMARHLRCPDGFFGRLVGIMMNKGNDYMNRFTLERLFPQSHDTILEIGFGNGKYLERLARKVTFGRVAGIDHSDTMVKLAVRANRALIREGRVEIKRGFSDNIPYNTSSFTKVFTVNTIYFWSNPLVDLSEIRRVLQPNGTLLLVFRSKEKMKKLSFTNQGFRLYEQSEVIELVKNAGFSDVSLETVQDGFLDINCIIATCEK